MDKSKNFVMSKALILLGFLTVFMSFAIPIPPFETNWDKPEYWFTNKKDEPKYEVIYDDELQGNAMRLYGDGLTYYFNLNGEKGKSLVTNKEYTNIINLDLKIEGEERFQMRVVVKAKDKNGWNIYITLLYEPLNVAGGRYSYYGARYGLGDIQDGKWHKIYRSIEQDFINLFPAYEILEIPYIIFSGDVCISNVKFYTELPEGAEITKPEVLASKTEYVYDDNTKKAVWSRFTQYDESGAISYYSDTYYSYYLEGMIKERKYFSYNSNNSLTASGLIEYSKDNNKSRCWSYNNLGKLTYIGISVWNYNELVKEWEWNGVAVYYNKDGTPWFISEGKDDNYRGWKSGSRWAINRKPTKYKNLDGNTIRDLIEDVDLNDSQYDFPNFRDNIYKDFGVYTLKEIYEEFIHEGGDLKKSFHTVYNPSGNIVSKETRYHIPKLAGIWGDWGICFERELYNEQGKLIGITKGRNFHGERLSGGVYSRVEYDYDVNYKLKEARMIYYFYNEDGYLGKKVVYCSNNDGKLKKVIQNEYEPCLKGFTVLAMPELENEILIKTEVDFTDNPVMDSDMQCKGIKPMWKPVGNPVCIKTKININGILQNALKIEKVHEDEEEGEPGYVQQFIPGRGDYKLTINYIRKNGKAIIEADWVPVEDLYNEITIEDMEKYSLVKFVDDSSEGLQTKDFIFETPANELGLLVLRLGGASTIIYTYAELKPYIYEPIKEKPPENYPEKKPEEQAKAQQAEPCDETGQEPIYIPKDILTENIVNNEIYTKEISKQIPVYGGFIILEKEKDEDKSIRIDKDSNVERKETRVCKESHIRTTLGEMVNGNFKEDPGINSEGIEDVISINRVEDEMASIKEVDDTYNWHIKDNEMFGAVIRNDLTNIKCSSIAPKTKLLRKNANKINVISIIEVICLRIKDWFINSILSSREFPPKKSRENSTV